MDTSDETDSIEEEEQLFLLDEEYSDDYHPCVNTNYYLGSYKYFSELGELVLMSQISKRIFYTGNYYSLRNFIYWYSGTIITDPNIQILQVFIKDHCATAVLKTYWIRLIQRTWKKIFRERQQYILFRKQLKYMYFHQLRSPSLSAKQFELRGMLSFLQKSK